MGDLDTLMEFLAIPLESGEGVFARFAALPNAVHRGDGLEQFLFVSGRRDNKVVLVAHADTIWDRHYPVEANEPQDIVQEDGIIRNTKGGLGADDRAGCAMLWLLRELGHSILITHGEEHGRQGSTWLMGHNKDIAEHINHNHQFMVQLDRRGRNDYKCYSVGTDCFRTYISSETGYKEPDRAAATDIVTLCRDITGVNLSIGYYDEHHTNERLVVAEWQNTLNICRNWLDQSDLPRFTLG